MRLVQVVLTDEQAELAAAALRDASNSEDVTLEESQTIYNLGYFFQTVSEEPHRFPLTGRMATSLPRKLKGPTPPAAPRNKRKARQEKRAGWAKVRRKNRAEMVKGYNEAVATMEAEKAEMEAIHAEEVAAIDAQPKFDVFNMDGTRMIAGVPESMIRPAVDVDSAAEDEAHAESQIILP